jgi:ribosomal protein L21
MQAIVKIGSSQFQVEPGLEILALKPQIDQVLYPQGYQVLVENLGTVKGVKVRTQKYKAKSRYHKTTGHRTIFHRLKITEVQPVKPTP